MKTHIVLAVSDVEKKLNRPIRSYEDIQEGAEDLLAVGAESILIEGSQIKDPLFTQDYWTNGIQSFWLANKRIPSKNYDEKAGALKSAITTCLALGNSIKDTIVIAEMFVNREIRHAKNIDKLDLSNWPEDEIDLPFLSPKPLLNLPKPFKHCQLGLYPVVDNCNWLELLLPTGVKCIQLRIKDSNRTLLEEEIKRAVSLAKSFDATLFINDYWELALQFGADGVHLGQDDLHEANIDKINQAGLFLGVSSNCYYEVARAHALNPSYIACGAIYPTTSKVMSSEPQGIADLKRWRRTLNYPLVAIGGISFAKLPEILETGVEGIALISAITKAVDPIIATRKFLSKIKEFNDG